MFDVDKYLAHYCNFFDQKSSIRAELKPELKENFSLKCKIPATGDVCVVGGNNIYTTAAPPSGKKAPPCMFANMQIEGKFHKL